MRSEITTEITDEQVGSIIEQFENLPDPRSTVNQRHRLSDVIVICICGVLAGADGPSAIAQWAGIHADWLKKHLPLPYGIPSHDTIGRVLERLQPLAFQECFAAWLNTLRRANAGDVDTDAPAALEHLAIDGKTLRRSHDRRKNLGALHMLSVWATERGISLGQLATEEKSNEITAIPQLLERIDVNNAVVTIDAMGCQKTIATAIIDGGGDYVLALKGNQGTLHRAVQKQMDHYLETNFAGVRVSRAETTEKGHGRREHRSYYQLNIPKDLKGQNGWAGLKTFGVAVRTYESDSEEHHDVRYYISSLKRNAKQFARVVREHWGIENTLHWSLDMTFREDESRTRGRNIADNLAWLRRITLTLLKQNPGPQSLVMKRRMAGWSIDYLMQLLTGNTT